MIRNKTVNVLLVNGWSDDNKGDSAILEGLIRLLYEVADGEGLDMRVSLVSSFQADRKILDHHYRHILRRYGVISVYGSALPTVYFDNKLLRRAYKAWQIARSFLLLFSPRGLPKYLLSREERETLKAFETADLVISKGGHIFFSTGNILSLLGMYQNAYSLLLAMRLGKSTVIFAQSIGPIIGKLHTIFLRKILANTNMIFTREPLSLELVKRILGLASQNDMVSRVRLTWDTAFVIGTEELPFMVLKKLPTRFVALTVRPWHFPYSTGNAKELYTRYLDSVAATIRLIYHELSLPVVIVPQVIGPYPLENDLIAIRDLSRNLGDIDVVLLEGDFSPAQLKTLYSKAELVIGTRFHSVILALSAGTPAVAISYHGYKTKGIMAMLGLSDYVVEIDGIDSHTLWQKVRTAYQRRADLRQELNRKMAAVYNESFNSLRQMLQDLEILSTCFREKS